MGTAAGQFPEQPGVDRAKGQPSRLCLGLRSIGVLEQPIDFCRAEISVQLESGQAAD